MLSISTLKFSGLFVAFFIPRVQNIQNLQLHMLTDLTHQRFHWGIFHMASTIDTLCRLSCYAITFVTNKKLTFCAGFYSKSLHSPLCSVTGIYLCSQRKDKMINKQPGASCFADTFRTAKETNVISLWSHSSMNASFLVHIRYFRISRIVTSLLSICKVLYHST